MKQMKILVVSREGESMDAYVQALTEIGVDYDAAFSFRVLSSMVRRSAYSGILVDILTLVRAAKDEKNIAYELMNIFPTTHIKWDPRHKTVTLPLLGQKEGTDSLSALRSFIDEQCRPFKARKVRLFPRREINLNLLLASDSSFPDEGTEKTFTVNLSKGGCFVFTLRPLETGEKVWLQMGGWEDKMPIEATVCWRVNWGEKAAIPGIGVRFEELSARQITELAKLLQPPAGTSDGASRES